MNDEINALNQGFRQGKDSLAGAMPSASNSTGSPPPSFPLSADFQQAISLLNSISSKLMKMPVDGRQAAHKVTKVAVELQSIQLDQEKKYQTGMEAAQNYGGGAASRANGISAMGVP